MIKEKDKVIVDLEVYDKVKELVAKVDNNLDEFKKNIQTIFTPYNVDDYRD